MTTKKLTAEEEAAKKDEIVIEPSPAEAIVAGDQVAGHDASKLKEEKAVIDKDAFGKGGVFKLNEDGSRTRVKA